MRTVSKWIDGRARCPYSPLDNSTAIMTEDGNYFIGASMDFSSNDHAIYKWSGPDVDKVIFVNIYGFLVWLSAKIDKKMN